PFRHGRPVRVPRGGSHRRRAAVQPAGRPGLRAHRVAGRRVPAQHLDRVTPAGRGAARDDLLARAGTPRHQTRLEVRRVEGIHDMGGKQGFGEVPELTDAPPFAEAWEGKAFVIGALAARIAGTNLHAFRHAIEGVPPDEYLVGYWNRWTIGAQIMMEDSGIVTDEQVRARAARLSGQDVPEPPPPTPRKPEMPSGGAGNLRSVETPRAFAVGDRVQ